MNIYKYMCMYVYVYVCINIHTHIQFMLCLLYGTSSRTQHSCKSKGICTFFNFPYPNKVVYYFIMKEENKLLNKCSTYNFWCEWWLHFALLQSFPINVTEEFVVPDGLFSTTLHHTAQPPRWLLSHELHATQNE